MTVATANSTPRGNYAVTVTGASSGASGTLTHSASVTLRLR